MPRSFASAGLPSSSPTIIDASMCVRSVRSRSADVPRISFRHCSASGARPSARLRAETGFAPAFDLRAAVAHYVGWRRENAR